MSGLFGGGAKPMNTSQPVIGGIKVQTSAYGVTIALVYGKTKIPPNLIWYGDFTPIAHTETQESGGKGGGAEPSKSTTYTYQAAVAFGLCEGPINGIGQVWVNKDLTTLSGLGLTLFTGATPQNPWGHLTTYHPGEDIGYSGTAYVAGSGYQLTDSAELRNHAFEVKGLLPYGGGIDDADPKDVITDYLTHTIHGAGFPSARMGNLTDFSDYCISHGLFISPAFTEQQEAHQVLTDLIKSVNAEIVWSAGLLKIIPYGTTSATGNGKTYTPNLTPQYDLTDDDFLPDGDEDPVMNYRSTPADAFNRVQVEFLNRANQYNPEVATANDQADIEINGLRPSSIYKCHWIVDAAVARLVAELIKQRVLYIRNTYEFRLGWKYYRLEPMDIVTLTDARLGLDKTPVLITEKEEDEHGTLSFKAEEFPWAAAAPPAYPSQSPGGYSVDYNVAPGNVNTPVIFEPPAQLVGDNHELWLAVSGGAQWGGAFVWVSTDNATYKQVGQIYGKARHGVLSANLAAGTDPDGVNTLSVDLSASKGKLLSGTQTDADMLITLCYVDGELIAYQTATLTSPDAYNLTYLRRGCYGSDISAHGTGGAFARLDDAIFRYILADEQLAGQTIYLKFTSFNIYGGGQQALSDVSPHTYVMGSKSLRTPPADPQSPFTDANSYLLRPVTGLQLYGQGNNPEFTGRDCEVVWNKVSLIRTQPAAGSEEGGAGVYAPDLYPRDYEVRIISPDNTTRRIEYTPLERYAYTLEKNYEDGGGIPTRSFTVEVRARDRYYRTSEAPARLYVSNLAPAVPGNITLAGYLDAFSVNFNPVAEPDVTGYLIHASQTSGFTPSEANLVSRGPNTNIIADNAAVGTWYVKIAAYDGFGEDLLIYSAQQSVMVDSFAPEIPPEQAVDFILKDSIFSFSTTTLSWTAGNIVRAGSSYTLSASSAANANNCFIIATLSGGTATISVSSIGTSLPSLAANQIILGYTSSTATAEGNYIAFIRQANSMFIEGAVIRDATIDSAKIKSLHANKIQVGTITADKYSELRNSLIFNGEDSLDATYPFEFPFIILSETTAIQSIKLSFKILPFRAYNTGAASGGGQTSSAGGASTPSSSTNAGTTHTHTLNFASGSYSGKPVLYYSNGSFYCSGGGTLTLSTTDGHNHTVTLANGIVGEEVWIQGAGNGIRFMCASGGSVTTNTTNQHAHTIDLDAGTTATGLFYNQAGGLVTSVNGNTISSATQNWHSHTTTIGDHTHTVSNHTHGITFGIYEETTAPTINVYRDNGSGYGSSLGSYTADQINLNITAQFTGTGWKKLKFTSTARCRIAYVLECKLDITA